MLKLKEKKSCNPFKMTGFWLGAAYGLLTGLWYLFEISSQYGIVISLWKKLLCVPGVVSRFILTTFFKDIMASPHGDAKGIAMLIIGIPIATVIGALIGWGAQLLIRGLNHGGIKNRKPI